MLENIYNITTFYALLQVNMASISRGWWNLTMWSNFLLSSGSVGIWIYNLFSQAGADPTFVYYWTMANHFNAMYGNKVSVIVMWYIAAYGDQPLWDSIKMIAYSGQQTVHWYWNSQVWPEFQAEVRKRRDAA